MRTVEIIISSLVPIIHFIGPSSQFDCFPDGNPLPGIPEGTVSDSPAGSSSYAESPLRARTRSPPDRDPSGRYSPARDTPGKSPPVRHPRSLEFKLDQVEGIQLIPKTNPLRRFEIHKYTFPVDQPIALGGRTLSSFMPIPNEERTVLTTSTGDVVAIIESNRWLSGVYYCDEKRRAGVKMKSGAVFDLSADLIQETPLGRRNTIVKNFDVLRSSQV